MKKINIAIEHLLEKVQNLTSKIAGPLKLKANRKEMLESKTFLASIVDSSNDAIISKDLNGIILSWNSGAQRLYGYSPKEAIGSHISMLAPSNLPDEIPKILKKIKSGERIDHFETVRKTKSGELLNISLTVSPFKDSSGQILGAATSARDITIRKQTEEALCESQKQLAGIIQGAMDAIITIDSSHRILVFNHAAEKLFDYPANQALGQSIDRFIPGRFCNSPTHLIETFGQTNVTSRSMQSLTTLMALRADGKEFPIEATISQVEVGGEKLYSMFIRDITRRKLTEEALQRSERRFSGIFHASPLPIAITRLTDGVYLDFNESFLGFTGYSRPEIVGQQAEKITWANPSQLVLELSQQSQVRDWETAYRTKNGEDRVASVSIEKIELDGEICLLSMFQDVTERNRVEATLQKTQMQLLQSQKLESVGRLAGGVAHDFNNLLTAIAGYTDLALLELSEDDLLYSDLSEIQKATQRAASLTHQLLAFSRQQVLKPKILNLNETLADMDKLLHRLIGEDIELISIPSPDLGETWADPGQLEQVIVNLSVNARDAMPDGGKLTIETANMDLDEAYRTNRHPDMKTGAYVMLAVTDTGLGMDQATQDRIFEPFFTTKETGKGTGLGLATVYGIVNQSEGNIWVYSELGVGTTFKVFLPKIKTLATTENQKLSPKPAKFRLATHFKEPANKTAYKILVVEDDLMVRELIQRVLTKAGYTILVAHNGQEAFTLLENNSGQIDLVMTDMIMPQMGGRELIAEIKTHWPEFKVVCMSGYTDRVAIRHGILDQCDTFLQKPFTPGVLLDKLDEAFAIND